MAIRISFDFIDSSYVKSARVSTLLPHIIYIIMIHSR